MKAWVSCAICVILLTGCLENGKSVKVTTGAVTSASTGGSYALSITTVNLDQVDPAGTLDIQGDGTGAIGSHCGSSSSNSSSNGNSGGSNCLCSYSYTYTDATKAITDPTRTSNQQVEVDTTYQEQNLVKCPYGSIPPSVTSITVSLQVKGGGFSNQVSFAFQNAGNAFDVTKDYNFARIFRYTCKQKVYIQNVLDMNSGIYDPFQSEDNPFISNPVSFYTSNLGASLMTFASKHGNDIVYDWECPADPRHPDSSFAETLYSTSQVATVDASPNVISGTPGAASNDMNADNPRSTFYLSKNKTGIFTVPVNSYIAPQVLSAATAVQLPTGGGTPALGWGAQARSAGNGTESCPSSTPTDSAYVAIPSGYHWVKVWLFRGNLPLRRYLWATNLSRVSSSDSQGIGCNPGNFSAAQDPTMSSMVPDCKGLQALSLGGATAARFLPGLGVCFTDAPQSYALASPDLNPLASEPQVDKWTAANQDVNNKCGANRFMQILSPYDPTNNTIGLDVCNGAAATGVTPFDSAPTIADLDSGSNRPEYIFVVTPNTINSVDMSNEASSAYAQYAPMRFLTQTDCNNVDPSNGACNQQHLIKSYGLKLYDVTTQGDPPVNGSTVPTFPLCALQPDSVK